MKNPTKIPMRQRKENLNIAREHSVFSSKPRVCKVDYGRINLFFDSIPEQEGKRVPFGKTETFS